MAFRYVLDVPCDLKGHLPLSLAMERVALAAVLPLQEETLAVAARWEPPEDVEFFVSVRNDSGAMEEQTTTLRRLRRQVAILDRYAPYCGGCPYAVRRTTSGSGAVLGCHGRIDYPLTLAVENLLALATTHLCDRAATDVPELVLWVLDRPNDGGDIAALRHPSVGMFARQQGASLPLPALEASLPIDALWSVLLAKHTSPAGAAKLLVPYLDRVLEASVLLLAQGAPQAALDGLEALRAYRQTLAAAARLGVSVRAWR